MTIDNQTLHSLGELKKYIKEKPARAIYEFIVLSAAVCLVASLLLGQGWGAQALIFPVFVIMVVMVLVLVAQDRHADPQRRPSFATNMIYFGMGLGFILLSLVLVAAVADAISGGRLAAWIPQKESAQNIPDLSDRFFGGRGFLDKIREEVQLQDDKGTRAPEWLSCKREIIFHYIGPKYQVGVRSFIQLSKANKYSSPSVKIFVRGDSEHNTTKINYITWPDTSNSKITMNSMEVGREKMEVDRGTATLPITDNIDGIAWIHGYEDPATYLASWFITPLDGCPNGVDETIINHFIAMDNQEIGKWNPNKYVMAYDVKTKTLQFSETVFSQVVADTNKTVTDFLIPILQRVLNAECATKEMEESTKDYCYSDSNKKAINMLKTLLPDGRFTNSVILYENEQVRTQSGTRVMIFKFF